MQSDYKESGKKKKREKHPGSHSNRILSELVAVVTVNIKESLTAPDRRGPTRIQHTHEHQVS